MYTKLGSVKDRSDWFELSMAHARLGHRDKAITCYDKAVAWINEHQPNDEDLIADREEARQLLLDRRR